MQPNITQAIMSEIFGDDIPDEAMQIVNSEMTYAEKVDEFWKIRRSDKYLKEFCESAAVDR